MHLRMQTGWSSDGGRRGKAEWRMEPPPAGQPVSSGGRPRSDGTARSSFGPSPLDRIQGELADGTMVRNGFQVGRHGLSHRAGARVPRGAG